MRHIFVRRTAIIVLLTFLFMIATPDVFLGKTEIRDLEDAKIFYKEGNYNSAIELFDRFIKNNKGDKQFKNELIEAYYYKAKIHFFGEEETKFISTLTRLFELEHTYNLSPDEDPQFLQKAKAIQEEVKKRLELKKSEEVQSATSGVIMHSEPLPQRSKSRWLLVAGVVVVVAVVIYFLTKKKPQKNLTVTVGEGVEGTPVSGSHSYKKGASASYNYSLKPGYTGLIVKLDDTESTTSGSIKMDRNHILTATATKTYTLTVEKGEGVNGTPDKGTFTYNPGETVNYSYSLKDGYKDLAVALDGKTVNVSGTITMNANQTLTASASPLKKYTLTVTRGIGINGTPAETKSYNEGEIVNYNYSLQTGYREMLVMLDGNPVANTGSITMDSDHTLVASAQKEYKLTVTKEDGVNGTPGSGIFPYKQGETVRYEYTLRTGYTNLIVKLDGIDVQPNGIITMDADHTLTAAAVPR